MTLEELKARCEVDANGCWLWTGYKIGGYGSFFFKNQRFPAHRLSLKLKLGREIDQGKQANHLCHVKACCNPEHIYEGTHTENVRDSILANRLKHGIPERASAISAAIGATIQARRLALGMTQAELAAKSDVSRATIGMLECKQTRSDPSVRILCKLADALDMTFEDLILARRAAVSGAA